MRLVRKKNISTPFRGELGELIYEMIENSKELGGSVKHSVAHVVIPPGKSSPAHFHKESEETYYGISGKGIMQVDEQRFYLEPGLAVLIMPDEVHQIYNALEDTDLEFLTISAPAWTPNDSFVADLPSIKKDLTK
jgi:mannose-6-phosphate isomerase-like protein (cupin superfamily)